MSDAQSPAVSRQLAIGAGVLAVGAVLAAGALAIPADAGYAGVGPNFLPWVVAAVLALCGGRLIWEATHGGFRQMEVPSGAARGDWRALAWVAAGVLTNAATITAIGFVLSCTVCFALAVRGLRQAEGRAAGGVRQALMDVAVGMAIALPVYWLFTRVLSISLPGLTGTGWL
ncbi:MAG: tripartite tricarboxylate transporter TctB family protein [Burkholderiaceae bacterium]|nr:tripartite tricarboxylate transporter TctB family protein [Burkholderiaceae bacterium]